MAISFQLNLTPNQIDFLQRLDLYASGHFPSILTVGHSRDWSINANKMIREGLVEHNYLPMNKAMRDGMTQKDYEAYRHYTITDKGRAVLRLIDDDVAAYIERQEEIRRLRKRNG